MNDPRQPPALRLTRYNPPGLTTLTYRGENFAATIERMIDRLQTQPSADTRDPGTAVVPLATLNIANPNDWSIALLHAWAAVIDVLSFYQERITNEGYLRTATEHRSILELARTIGYELRPGKAAATDLVFTVLVDKNQPRRQVEVPAGVAVQSVPPPGQLPQIFETGSLFVARSAWNAMRLSPESNADPVQDIRRDATTLRLAGMSSDLKPGDRLLLRDAAPPAAGERPFYRLVTLLAVKPDPARGATVITWEPEAGQVFSSDPLQKTEVYALRTQAALFGYTQGGVYSGAVDPTVWLPSSLGMPDTPVYALLSPQTGVWLAGSGAGMFRSADRGETWQPLAAGLVRKPMRALATMAGGDLLAGSDDGTVYLSRDAGAKWTVIAGETVLPPAKGLSRLWSPALGEALPKTVIHAVAGYARGKTRTLVLGTDKGLFRSDDEGRSWNPANEGLPDIDPKTGLTTTIARALAVVRQGRRSSLFAATQAGVFRVQDAATRWPAVIGLAVALIVASRLTFSLLDWLTRTTGAILTLVSAWANAALAALLALARQLQLTLPPITLPAVQLPDLTSTLAKALQGVPVVGSLLSRHFQFIVNFLLVFLGLALLFIGRRILVRYLAGRRPISLGIPVNALLGTPQGALFAGTDAGVFRSNDGPAAGAPARVWQGLLRFLLGDLARRWQPVSTGLVGTDIRALAVTPQGDLLAGTGDGHIFRSGDAGTTWQALNDGLTLTSVLALGATAEGYLAAGVPITRAVESHWSAWQLARRSIDLDGTYPDLTSDTWVVLRAADGSPTALVRAEAVTEVESRDALKPGPLTRLVVDAADELAQFDRATTHVFAHSERLPLLDETALTGDRLVLDGLIPDLEAGRRLIVSGKRLRARPAGQPAADLQLLSQDGLQARPIAAGESLTIMAPAETLADGGVLWHLRNKHGFAGQVLATQNAFVVEPSHDDDEIVSEAAAIRTTPASGTTTGGRGQTIVVLHSVLANAHDRATVVVYGNVVPATHGQTVTGERLGSSDGLAVNQRFLLKQRPLTYIAADTPGGVESALKIEVNGVTWQEVPVLHGLGAGRRAYMLRRDAQGNTAVIFGDSEDGAGLPQGTTDLRATYRHGSGAPGNVDGGSLKLLQTAVPGIKGVTNPIAATGGSDADHGTQVRWDAPQTVRAMERLVSLSDYEDFTRRQAGIGKANARLLSNGPRQVLHVTIADTVGAPLPVTSATYTALVEAIDTWRAVPQPRVQIDSYIPVYFNVRADLLLEPDQLPRKDAIVAAARQALVDVFAFARRDFAQPVAASEVIAVMQNVSGVRAVDLTALYPRQNPESLNLLLTARPARWDGLQAVADEMLVINVEGDAGITLEVVT